MARIPYPDVEKGDAQFQALVGRIKEERGGRMLNLYRMLLNSAPLAEGWLNLLTAVRYKAVLDGKSRELAICEVARLTKAEYEWRAHARLALQEGVTDAQLAALPDWQASRTLFTEKEQAVLGYAQESTRDVQVSDQAFEALRKHLNQQEICELAITVGAYNMVSRLLVGLQVDIE